MPAPTLDELKGNAAPSLDELSGKPSVTGGAVASVTEGFKQAARDQYTGLQQATATSNNQLANLFMILDKASEGISQVTGLDRGGAFGRVEEWFRGQAEAYQQEVNANPNRPGVIDDLNRFIGSLPSEGPKAAAANVVGPVAGFAGLGALTNADQGITEAAKGALEGGLIGKIFQVAAPGGRLARTGTVGSGVIAIESAFGADPIEALKAGATAGLVSGLAGGPGVKKTEPISFEKFKIEQKERLKGPPAIARPVEAPIVEVTTPANITAQKLVGKPVTRVQVGPDKVVNLNLRRIAGPDDFKQMQRTLVEEFRPQIDQARRGAITLEETARMAEALGVPKDLLTKRPGTALNAEELTASRVIHQSIAKELFDSAKRISRGQADDLTKADFGKLIGLYEASAKHALGATAEAGRAFGALRITAGPARQQLAEIRELMGRFNGTKGQEIEDFAEMISRLDTPGKLTQAIEAARKPTASDKFIEVYVNGLLSNPATQVVNGLSNTLTSLWAIPETYVAGAFSGLTKAASVGRPAPERVFMREANARMYGFVEGAKDGLRLAGKTLRTGETSDLLGKIESRQGAVGGTVGKVIRIPSNMLMAGDEFFKAIGMRQELHAQAVRAAATQGLRGTAFRNKVAELLENPTEAMREAAIATARRQTFTEALGPVGRSVMDFSNSHPLFKVIIPFVRTPTNIFKFAAKRSPLAPFFEDVRANLAKGGAAQATELGRIAFGTSASVAAMSLAAEGKLTGSGPADPDTRRAWFAAGYRPYSVKVGDRWVSYGRLEPLASIIGVAADMSQVAGTMSEGELEEAGALVWLSFRKNVENKTFIQGLAGLMLATSDPERYGDDFIGRTLSGMLPAASLLTNIARNLDPTMRRADSIIEHVKSRVPGYSSTLEPRINIWGEPVILDGGLGPDFVSPLYSHRQEPDLAGQEVLRTGAKLRPPKDVIKGVALTPPERTRLEMATGKLAKTMIDQLVNDPSYRNLPKTIQRDMIEKFYDQARSVARTQVFSTILTQEPGRFEKVVTQRTKDLTGEEANGSSGLQP